MVDHLIATGDMGQIVEFVFQQGKTTLETHDPSKGDDGMADQNI